MEAMVMTMMKKSGAALADEYSAPDAGDAASSLAAVLRRCGFDAETWKGERVYLAGYGPAVRAYLTLPSLPSRATGLRPCDGARLVVTSFWKSTKSGLHAKGVKHAILCDLHRAGLISQEPPERWQDVSLDDSAEGKRVIRRFGADAEDADLSLAHDQIV
jgi:hypothetical protein